MDNQIAVLIMHISIAVLQKPEKSITRLFLKKSEDGTTVSFNNIPFSLEEVRILDCQYGKHYFKKREWEQMAATPRQQKNWLSGKN